MANFDRMPVSWYFSPYHACPDDRSSRSTREPSAGRQAIYLGEAYPKGLRFSTIRFMHAEFHGRSFSKMFTLDDCSAGYLDVSGGARVR
jgi:hypothetical protein